MFTKYIAPALVAVAFLSTASAAETPDFTRLKKALAEFVATLDAIQMQLPKIDNAPDTAKAFDSLSKATNDTLDALAELMHKYPDLVKATEPPPEFASEMTTIENLKVKYASLEAGMAALGRRYASDPEVAAAIARLNAATTRKFSPSN